MTFNLFYFILKNANIVLHDDALFVELLVMVEIKVNARVCLWLQRHSYLLNAKELSQFQSQIII